MIMFLTWLLMTSSKGKVLQQFQRRGIWRKGTWWFQSLLAPGSPAAHQLARRVVPGFLDCLLTSVFFWFSRSTPPPPKFWFFDTLQWGLPVKIWTFETSLCSVFLHRSTFCLPFCMLVVHNTLPLCLHACEVKGGQMNIQRILFGVDYNVLEFKSSLNIPQHKLSVRMDI